MARRGFGSRDDSLHRMAGSPVLAVFAGASVLFAGSTAAALAGSHAPAPGAPAAGAPAAACQRVCVSVQAGEGTVEAGQTASFGIHIAPSSGLDQVTVRITVTSSGVSFPAPAFTSCAGGQTCTIGLLRAGQATDLGAGVLVPGSARAGTRATLSATVTWSLLGLIGTGSAAGSATIGVAGPRPSPTPTPHPTTTPPGGGHPSPTPPGRGHPGPPPPGGSPPGGSAPGGRHPGRSHPGSPGRLGVPGLDGAGLGARPEGFALPLGGRPQRVGGGADGNYGNLFPLIQPLPAATGAGPAAARAAAAAGRGHYRATETAGVLPLGARQLGIQVAGLLVLFLGAAIAVARIPLRRRRSG